MARFNDLFLHNMDEVLQEIFLLLDPKSLHDARQVRASDSSAGWTKVVTKVVTCQVHSMLKLSNLSDVKAVTLHLVQVCHQWNQFILERLWGSRVGRRILQRRLEDRWRGGRPFVSSKDFWDSMVIQVDTDKNYPFESKEPH